MPPKTRNTERSTRSEPSSFSVNRRAALIGAAISLLFLGSSYYAYNNYIVKHLTFPHVHSLADRLILVLRHQILSVAFVVFTIQHVALIRATTLAINPLSGHESYVDRANRVLANSLEQFIINLVNQLVFVTYVTEDRLRLVPLLSFYFLIGRISFWIGYQIAPKHRHFGFWVNNAVNLILAATNIYLFATTSQGYLFETGRTFGRP